MRPISPTLLTAACLALLVAGPAAAQPVTSPEEHLGRPLGTDFQLADWEEVSSWYRKIADESPRVQTTTVGSTTEGRDFLLTIISSEENMGRLQEFKRHAKVFADPDAYGEEEIRAAVEEGKVILFISPQLHSTEAAGSEAGIGFTYKLVTSEEEPWASARENLVVGIFPCTNPDGLDHVVDWYREHVGTPYESTGMLELYQRHSGHDNNRDWFMLSNAETRIVTNLLYNEWFPQVYWDIHQQGGASERFFVPPYRDPLNPNIDPAITGAIAAVGSRALLDMTRAGLSGISTGVTYDAWWNGGNRSVPTRHNMLGILTEAASADLASPVFWDADRLRAPGTLPEYQPSTMFPDPWPGGWWRIGDIIDYQVAFGESLAGTLAREREFWLRNAMETAQRAIKRGREEGPRAWIIPTDNRDPDAIRRLVDTLFLSGVEVHVASEEITADGRTYPEGSIVIRADQAYGNHVRDLFEVQRYPKGDPPYDVAGWTLPLLLGIHRVEVMAPLESGLTEVYATGDALAAFAETQADDDGRWSLPAAYSSAWTKAFSSLQEGSDLFLVAEGDSEGMLTTREPGDDTRSLAAQGLPRIGVYAPWSPVKNEGWLRWVLDEWDVPYTRVRNEQLRAGRLSDFMDVLVVPNMSSGTLDDGRSVWDVPGEYVRGLAPEGAAAIEEFVRDGGRLVTSGEASNWAIDLLQLPLVDVTTEKENAEFYCPGSVLRAIPAQGEAFNAGLPGSIALMFSRSAAYREMTSDERKETRRGEADITTLLSFAPTRVLLSGYIREPQAIEGRDALLHVAYGEGDVYLFSFEPHYRTWSQGTFPLLFRAMLFAGEDGEGE